MARTLFVDNIAALQQSTWPIVRVAVAQFRKSGSTKSNTQLTHRETVWTLAKQGALRTGGERALVNAAREYLADLDDLDEYEQRMKDALDLIDASDETADKGHKPLDTGS